MTTKELINQYVTAHADNRWMDASELEALLTEFAEKLKEPASEDLEQAGKEWLRPQLDKSYANYGERKMMDLTRFDGYAMLDAIEFGAQWRKEKDYKDFERLKKSWFEEGKLEGKFEGITDDVKYQQGYHDAKEQMMKDAIDTRIDKRLADMIGYTGSERVKVIIIKE